MLRALVALVCVVMLAGPAAAQSSITLNANPTILVDASINGRPVRLEVDLRFPDVLVLSQAAAERLGVRRVPLARVVAALDDARVSGRLARPHVAFANGERVRVNAGVFPVPASRRADGVIGPGVLPYDRITIVLGGDAAGARDIVLSLDDPDIWRTATDVGGVEAQLSFDSANAPTVLNRSLASALDASGGVAASGDLEQAQLMLGLRTLMQPVTSDTTVAGLALGPTLARTRSPLLGAEEEGAVTVLADANLPPPALWLGRSAISHCASISVDRSSRTLTLRCAG